MLSVPPLPAPPRQITPDIVQTDAVRGPLQAQRKRVQRKHGDKESPAKPVRKRGRPAKARAPEAALSGGNKSSEAMTNASASEGDALRDDPETNRKRKRAVKCHEKLLEVAPQDTHAGGDEALPPRKRKFKATNPEATMAPDTRPARRRRRRDIHDEANDESSKPGMAVSCITITEKANQRQRPTSAESKKISQERPAVTERPLEQHKLLPSEQEEQVKHLEMPQERPERRGRPPKPKVLGPDATVAESKASKIAASGGHFEVSAHDAPAADIAELKSETRGCRKPKAQKQSKSLLRETTTNNAEPVVAPVDEANTEGTQVQSLAGSDAPGSVATKSESLLPHEEPVMAPSNDNQARETLPGSDDVSIKQHRRPAAKTTSKRKPITVDTAGRDHGKKLPAPARPSMKPPRQPRTALQLVSPNTSPKRQKLKDKTIVEDWQKQDWFKASVPSTLMQSSDPRLRFRF